MIAPRGVRPVHYEGMEIQLKRIFKKVMFDPIVDIIRDTNAQLTSTSQIFNSPDDDLRKALRSGKIQYSSGIFSGSFSSSTSKALMALGAKWDKRMSVYRMDPASVPNFVKSESTVYQSQAELAHKAIVSTLDSIGDNLDKALEGNEVKAGRLTDQVVSDFKDVARAIGIDPSVTHEVKEKISREYTENMNLWIKKWCEEEIMDLRTRVEKNAFEGYRFDELIAMIQNRYGVSESKAQFLARQETALFVSKFNEQRVKEAGVISYEWSTSHDERVRKRHRELDGRTFFFDEPPIVDQATGRRGNPGEDFNCRCVPIPILERVPSNA